MRKVFVVTSALLVLGTVLQLYFAAMGHFSEGSRELFPIHGTNGRMVLPILAILNIIGAAVSRAGSRTIWLSVLPLVLLLLQTGIFILTGLIWGLTGAEGEVIPLGASIFLGLHGLNGLVIIAVSGTLLNRAIRNDRRPVDSGVRMEAPATADVSR